MNYDVNTMEERHVLISKILVVNTVLLYTVHLYWKYEHGNWSMYIYHCRITINICNSRVNVAISIYIHDICYQYI